MKLKVVALSMKNYRVTSSQISLYSETEVDAGIFMGLNIAKLIDIDKYRTVQTYVMQMTCAVCEHSAVTSQTVTATNCTLSRYNTDHATCIPPQYMLMCLSFCRNQSHKTCFNPDQFFVWLFGHSHRRYLISMKLVLYQIDS